VGASGSGDGRDAGPEVIPDGLQKGYVTFTLPETPKPAQVSSKK
jgi:hypothetical protein